MPRKYELKLNENTFTITVDGSNDNILRVTIGDTTIPVKIQDSDRVKGIYRVTVDGKELLLHAKPDSDTAKVQVQIQKQKYQASLKPVTIAPRPERAPSYSQPTVIPEKVTPTRSITVDAALDPGTVAAPLPGRVLEVQVKQNDKVKLGDVLLVLEAMKMANEIRAPLDGVVIQVHVQSGATVEKGQSLVTIE